MTRRTRPDWWLRARKQTSAIEAHPYYMQVAKTVRMQGFAPVDIWLTKDEMPKGYFEESGLGGFIAFEVVAGFLGPTMEFDLVWRDEEGRESAQFSAWQDGVLGSFPIAVKCGGKK